MNKTILNLIFFVVSLTAPVAMAGGGHGSDVPEFQERMASFSAEEAANGMTGIWEKVSYRAEQQPFLLVASIIFLCAIVHTFFAVPITKYAHKLQHDHDAEIRRRKECRG